MRNYSFSQRVDADEWYHLFHYMLENPSFELEVTDEILEAKFNDKIDMSKPFNLVGYQKRVQNFGSMVTSRYADREVNIEDEDIKDTLSDTPVEQFESSLDLEIANKFFQENNSYFFMKYEIDINALIQDALNGITVAVNTLKDIILNETEDIQYMFKIYLANKEIQ